MTFDSKMDDKNLKVDLSVTNLSDILIYCKPKEQLVLIKKFGLAAEWKEIPLQQIWSEFNMTRERARQIETQALMRFRRLIVWNDRYLAVIDKAIGILEDSWGVMLQDELISKVFSHWSEFTAPEIKIILMSDFTITHLRRNKLLYKLFYVDNLYEVLLSDIASTVNAYFTDSQEHVSIYEYIEQVKPIFVAKYQNVKFLKDNNFYLNFFHCIRGISVFDGNIWLSTNPTVQPKTVKDKILYVFWILKKPLHYQEMATKVMEFFPNKPVKVSSVHNDLVKNNKIFVNTWLGMYALKSWGFKWGIVADILVRILHSANRPMSIKELTQHVSKEKMCSPNTILLNLHKYKDKFLKNPEWLYYLNPTTSLEPTKVMKWRRKKVLE